MADFSYFYKKYRIYREDNEWKILGKNALIFGTLHEAKQHVDWMLNPDLHKKPLNLYKKKSMPS